jgi:hypothetical protein
MGFLSPTAHTGSESPRPSRVTGRLSNSIRRPGWRSPAGPTPPATVPLTGFLNLSATFSSLCRPAIFRQVALMGFALQGFVPSTKPPATHRYRNTLLSLLPPVALPRYPRPGSLWAYGPSPRTVRDRTIFRLQGLRPRESRSRRWVTIENVPSTRPAPPGLFTSSWY